MCSFFCKSGLIIVITLLIATAAADDLASAAAAGDLERVTAMVEQDASCLKNADPSGRTALHAAAYAGHAEVVAFLLKHGAPVDARDNKDRTPLHLAAYAGQADVIRALLAAGADKTAVDRAKKTPADAAAARNHPNVVALLLDDEVVPIAGRVYRVTAAFSARTNIAVMPGRDGVLVVDTGLAATAEDLLARVVEFGKGKPKVVINTHWHGAHTDGNATVVGDAILINPANLEQRVAEGALKRGDAPIRGYGDLSFETYYTLRFNDEDVRLIRTPGSHTPDDMIIHFVDSGVVVMQDLLDSQAFPPIGPSVQSWMLEIDRTIATMPPGTRFIAGHGRDMRLDELREYRRKVQEATDAVRAAIRAGKTVEQMRGENVLERWKEFGEFMPQLGPNYWIQAVYNSYPEDRPRETTTHP